MSIDLNAAQQTAIQIARDAGTLLLDYQSKSFTQTTKANVFDIVTEADVAAEKLIVEALMAQYPSHHLVGEEAGGRGAPIETAQYRWYIDPIDGTTNFANRIPFFNVSIALTDADMNPLMGVVYAPVFDEMFAATTGQGATLNDRPIQVSADTDLTTCVLCTGFSSNRATNPDNNLAEWEAVLMRSRSLRRIGSAALELAYIGVGRLDGYWERNLHPWDCLAGGLIAVEGGGKVTDQHGNTASTLYERGYIVATNGHIHDALLSVLAEAHAKVAV